MEIWLQWIRLSENVLGLIAEIFTKIMNSVYPEVCPNYESFATCVTSVSYTFVPYWFVFIYMI